MEDYAGSVTIKYIIQRDTALILSCTGSGDYVKLPDSIDGIPVSGIGSYCFSAPEEGIENLGKEIKIKDKVISGADTPFQTDELLAGKKLKEIYLPDALGFIGEYAFYNCTELEHISLSGGGIDFGNGAFMNCDNLKQLTLRAKPEDLTGLAGFLRELQGELKVTYATGKEEAVFLFPEYFEESIENTPARVFHYQIHGAGYRYRQCLENGILNIQSYDSLFQTPEIQTEEKTALTVALYRLKYPYGLSGFHKKYYIQYLKLHREETIVRYIEENDASGLYFIKKEEVLIPELMDYAVKEAIKRKQPECVSILINMQFEMRKPNRDRFEL